MPNKHFFFDKLCCCAACDYTKLFQRIALVLQLFHFEGQKHVQAFAHERNDNFFSVIWCSVPKIQIGFLLPKNIKSSRYVLAN